MTIITYLKCVLNYTTEKGLCNSNDKALVALSNLPKQWITVNIQHFSCNTTLPECQNFYLERNSTGCWDFGGWLGITTWVICCLKTSALVMLVKETFVLVGEK